MPAIEVRRGQRRENLWTSASDEGEGEVVLAAIGVHTPFGLSKPYQNPVLENHWVVRRARVVGKTEKTPNGMDGLEEDSCAQGGCAQALLAINAHGPAERLTDRRSSRDADLWGPIWHYAHSFVRVDNAPKGRKELPTKL